MIFVFLALFAFSLGIWATYSMLWLEVHNISIRNISFIISGATFSACFIALGTMFLFKKANILHQLKFWVLAKIVAMLGMIFLFQSGILWLITTLFIIDAVATLLIGLKVYPLIVNMVKTNKIYSHRKLIEYIMTDIGLIIAGVIIAFAVTMYFQFNLLLIISTAVMGVAFVLLLFVHLELENKPFSIKRIYKDKIVIGYQFYVLAITFANGFVFGMLALIVTDIIGLSPWQMVLFITVAHIAGDIYGYLGLWKLRFKSDYLNFASKFGLRMVAYAAIAITANVWVAIVGLFLSMFVSRVHEDIVDGVYINRVHVDDQLAFANIRFGVGRIGTAIGVFICGLIFHLGMPAIFGFSAVGLVMTHIVGFWIIHLRHKESVQNKIVDNVK